MNIQSDYRKNGVAVLRSLLSDSDLLLLREAIDRAESNPSPMASNLANGDNAYFFNDFNTWRKNSAIEKIIWHQSLRDVATKVVSTKEVRLFHDHILIKRGFSQATPWHQDRPYYFVEGQKNYSIWMSPDSVHRDEGLSFLQGSHLLDSLFVPVNFRDGSMMDVPDGMEALSDARLTSLKSECAEIAFDLEPGDALVFDNRVVHMARRSKSAVDRSALSIRYLGDDARLTWKGVNQTPPFHRMGMKFDEGDVPSEAWFPMVSSSGLSAN
jgi:ectoine hydroxylase-related dioxygenase (phytanoyl-CoA dioxygenase family)